jgi:cytochrome P450
MAETNPNKGEIIMTVQSATLTKRVPEVPPDNFLMGNIQAFQKDSLRFITRVAYEHGPVVRYRLGNLVMYAMNRPDAVQHVLQDNNRNYLKGDYFKILRAVAGNGLFTSEGAHWLRQRRLMQPSFHRQRIANFADIMTRRTQEMMMRWEPLARSGQALDFAQEMTDLTMTIISEAMFSTHFKDANHIVSKAIAHLLEDMNFRFVMPFYPHMRFPTPRNLAAQRALRVVDDAIYGIIHERQHKGVEGDDLLGMLMSARDEETGEAMSASQLRDEVVTIFIAGHETTALSLTWMFYLLSQHPAAADRLYAEVEQVLGGRMAEMKDLPKLVYTRQVIDETLRLYPPAWITNRTALEADEVCGFPIPRGVIAAVSPYVTHRLPEFWPEPERFDPDRFLPENSAGRPRFAYIPFGAGPHQCIGNNFALVEATLIAATIAQRCRLALAPGEQVTPQTSLTLRPRGGLRMVLQERSV